MIYAVLAFAAIGLYEQSIARVLEARHRDPSLSYLVMDTRTGTVFASRWTSSDVAIAPGSLVKPFLSMTAKPDTQFECRPGDCWLPRGHGRLLVSEAIAASCNSWFRQLAKSLRPAAFEPVAVRFGLPLPPAAVDSLIGLGTGWSMQPVSLMRSYGALIAAPDADLVRHGLAMSAASGTGRLAGGDILIKTGTAPCSHHGGGPGDGLAICAFPAPKPRYILLVDVHGTTGAMAARSAGEIIRSIDAAH